jgi:tetraprenyl-beta-curcumene synthase
MDGAFLSAAACYWTSVFPLACREISVWKHRADAIPNPVLRALALNALQVERGNLEGATAFAAFVPRAQRQAVVGAMVAFQAAYDYADAVSEQPWQHQPLETTACLHNSLVVAVDPTLGQIDYYAHSPHRDDGRYLSDLVCRCRNELIGLPSISVATAALSRAAARIVNYQRANHDRESRRDRHRDYWAATGVPQASGLAWWEVAAAAGSSLAVFALMALVANADADSSRVSAIEQVYFPWIGALHTLLDSLVDRHEDTEAGQSSLIDHYRSESEVSAQLEALASSTAERAELLDERHHSLILSAMAGFYLAGAHNSDLLSRLTASKVLSALGHNAESAAAVISAERGILRLLARARTRTSS